MRMPPDFKALQSAMPVARRHLCAVYEPGNAALLLALARLGGAASIRARDDAHAHSITFRTNFGHCSGTSIAGRGVHIQSALLSEMRVKEVRHDFVCVARLGQVHVVPESVGQSLEDNELGVHSCLQEGLMQNGGSTQEQVAGAGDEEGWGQS